MSYIIVWRNRHRDPHVGTNTHDFLETYSSYEIAKEEAERIEEEQGTKNPWYFDYAIYEEVES
jgi:hypothetical protein